MNILKEFDIILKEAKNSGEYWRKGVPSTMMKIDSEINRIVEQYILISTEEKKIICNGISTEIAWLLLCFATKMATYSLRFSEQKYFSNGLTALSMILGILDQREIILIMPLYYDVSIRNNLTFDMILEQNDSFKDFLKEFLSRREEDKTIECMGYVLSIDENKNLVYKRTW